jgi:hypothetical protein
MTQRVLCEKKSLLFLVDIAREQNYFNTTYIYIYIYIYIDTHTEREIYNIAYTTFGFGGGGGGLQILTLPLINYYN